jgi:patatin-like phospholipase/acyl hydrolase
VFQVDQVLAGRVPLGDSACRFDYNLLENAIKKLIKDKLDVEEDCKMDDISSPRELCRTFVVATLAGNVNAPATVFRAYSGDDIRPSKCPLWHAARATSAAPSFFKPMCVEPPRPGIIYVDGGLGYNNPAEVALDEARRVWPENKHFCLVSIGTGRPNAVKIVDSTNIDGDIDAQRSVFEKIRSHIPNIVNHIPGWRTAKNFPPGVFAIIKMASALAKMTTDSEAVNERIQGAAESHDIDKSLAYFRFSVDRDVGDIGLGDWKKAGDMATHTQAWMSQHVVRKQKKNCIERLINSTSLRK